MKIIDRTPFLGPDGQINILDRLSGTLQFGLSWYPELQAQQAVISLLAKQLEKFTLIRNLSLGRSGITIPIILLGPPGVYVLYVTHLRGMYQARGDAWGQLSGDRVQPAAINLLTRTARMGRALSVFLQRQGVDAGTVETALLAADPGMHIESIRPIVRVVMSDGLERFAQTLAQARPTISIETVHLLSERILEPRPNAAAPAASQAPASFEPGHPAPDPRADETPAWNPSELGFAFGEEEPASVKIESEPGARMRSILTGAEAPVEPPAPRAQGAAPARPRRKRGLSRRQLLLLVIMGGFELLLVIVFFVLVMNS